MKTKPIAIGDYVLATKYNDGDPKDGWAIGWVGSITNHFNSIRYIIVDATGTVIGRANGFRRAKRISWEKGAWIVNHATAIEKWYSYSMWTMYRTSMENLAKLNL